MAWLTHTEELLDAQKPINGDPKVIEVELAKHHVSTPTLGPFFSLFLLQDFISHEGFELVCVYESMQELTGGFGEMSNICPTHLV